MKLKFTLLPLLMFLCAFTFGASPTIKPVVSPTRICQGDTITVAIVTSDTFVTGNIFKIQLSDSTGAFGSPVVLDTIVGQGNDTISFLAPVVAKNSGRYRIRVVASNAATGLDSTYLTIHHTPVVGFQLPKPFYCTYAYTVPLTGGSPTGGVYSGTYVANSAFQSNVSDTGTFEIYYTYTDTIGCYAGDSTAINITTCPAPSVSVQVSPVGLCAGGVMNVNIQTSDVIGSDNIFTVQLSDSTGSFTNPTLLALDTNSSTNTIQITVPTEPVGTHYQVRVVASDPSTISVPFNVSFKTHLTPPNVTLNATGNINLCTGGSYILKTDSLRGISYQWSFNGVPFAVTKYTYTAKDSGLYVLAFTDTTAAGCSSGADSVFIGVYPYAAKPAISQTGVVNFCGSGTVTLSTAANNAVSFQWTDHGQNITAATSNTFTVDTTGVYLVEAVTSHGCITRSDSVGVNIHNNPVVTFNIALDTFCINAPTVALYGGSPAGSGGYYSGNYVDNGSSFNQALSGIGSFEVHYTFIDSSGCRGTDSSKINIYNCTGTRNPTGIDELNTTNTFEMFPNPATSQVHISTYATSNCTMKLFNLLGQEIGKQVFNQQITYSVGQLPAGVYLVEISDISNTWKSVKRLIVQ